MGRNAGLCAQSLVGSSAPGSLATQVGHHQREGIQRKGGVTVVLAEWGCGGDGRSGKDLTSLNTEMFVFLSSRGRMGAACQGAAPQAPPQRPPLSRGLPPVPLQGAPGVRGALGSKLQAHGRPWPHLHFRLVHTNGTTQGKLFKFHSVTSSLFSYKC